MDAILTSLIDSWATLPRQSEAHLQERLWFDLKETYSPQSRAEMAKDVAAFANALGGALIIGAKEGPTAPDYSSPLSIAHAEKIEHAFDEAVRDLCRPSPTVHIRTIPVPEAAGKAILVVNVEPLVDQPVAARHDTDANSWRFPVRVGRHTEYILPEQLPLYMSSKTRRSKLLLLRALASGGAIDLFTVPSGLQKRGDLQGASEYVIEEVDRDSGGAFVVRDAEGGFDHQAASVPIDDVEAIWLQATNRWAVRISGRLEQFCRLEEGAKYELEYVPPTTFVVSPLEKVVSEVATQVKDLGRVLAGTLSVETVTREEPSDALVAERAYQRWAQRVARGRPGTADDDWHLAKAELKARARQR